jgi:hypothetical protein
MLKFEKVAKVGDVIRAYDFKPCAGRDDASTTTGDLPGTS